MMANGLVAMDTEIPPSAGFPSGHPLGHPGTRDGSRELAIRFVALLLKVDIRVTCAPLIGLGR